MICTKCGASLLDTDQFCPECGAKVIRERRCPDCGAVLREGTKFCHKCGRLVEKTEKTRQVSEETLDIPIEAIEKNILSETEAKIKAEQAGRSPAHKTQASGTAQARRSEGGSASGTAQTRRSEKGQTAETGKAARKKKAAPEPPSRSKRAVYQEEDWEDEDWEDEEEEGVDAITVMTAVAGCVLLVVLALLGYHLYRQYVPKNYTQLQEAEMQEDGQEIEESGTEEESAAYTLTIVSNVNVRDNPSTSGTNILKVAKAGETYECYGSAGDGSWYEIGLEDGTRGYVFQDYVSVE
ncbi:MAG: zinc-ribbon domain-containing protein [Clostridiales bacterium]|nr:zinc-ribbon domain-containing protein [Clostridiales bacterium]